MSPEQISIIWRDISKFFDDVVMEAGNGGWEAFWRLCPDLSVASADLRGVPYTDPNWSYCDKQPDGGEPIPKWKDTLIKVGRWILTAVAVGIALITCQWQLVFALVAKWSTVEEVSREFCGWVCA